MSSKIVKEKAISKFEDLKTARNNGADIYSRALMFGKCLGYIQALYDVGVIGLDDFNFMIDSLKR